MTIVVDASTVVSTLVDSGAEGRWAEQILLDHDIVAPGLLLVECTNVLRRLTASGEIVDLEASMAHCPDRTRTFYVTQSSTTPLTTSDIACPTSAI